MEKQYEYQEISAIIEQYVNSKIDKGPWYIIGALQAHLTMSLTGMDAEYIIKHLQQDIK